MFKRKSQNLKQRLLSFIIASLEKLILILKGYFANRKLKNDFALRKNSWKK